MTTKQLISLDFRQEENRQIIQTALRKIKPLSKFDEEEIPISAIERAITVMCKKYPVSIMNLVPDNVANDRHTVWRATIIDDKTFRPIEKVYGICLYELFAKLAIRIYVEVKRGG